MLSLRPVLLPLLLTFLCVSFLCFSSYAATTLDVDSEGNLLGAHEVSVNGVLYDVRFVDDTALNLYFINGQWNFLFNTIESADAASQALLDQVLVGDFASNPELVNGIERTYSGLISTPYQINTSLGYVDTRQALIYESFDNIINWEFSYITNDLTNDSNRTFAVWEVSSVPVPASAFLLGFGLLSLAGINRSRRFR